MASTVGGDLMERFVWAAEAAYYLRVLRLSAFTGGQYAAQQFDRAVLDHRRSERELLRALLSVRPGLDDQEPATRAA